jgi:hypothetical protein
MSHKGPHDAEQRLHPHVQTPAAAFAAKEAARANEEVSPTPVDNGHHSRAFEGNRLAVPSVTLTEGFAAAEEGRSTKPRGPAK